MPVLDDTSFGDKPEGGGILYGDVRKIIDEQRKLEILKGRIDSYLIRQVTQLTLNEENGQHKVYSPFPLAVLTLLSIETIGRIIHDLDNMQVDSEDTLSKGIVTPIYQLMDINLSYKPSKEFYKNFKSLHGKDDKKSIKRYSDIIHKYQRNTFNHGYQSRGVYLTEHIHIPWGIGEDKGCLYINPYLFWDLFKKTYDYIFDEILNSNNLNWRQNSLKYFHQLLE